MDFIVSDSGLNRYKFRVLTTGILLENFLANPIMYYEHETSKIPIGTWSNLRIEGDELIATANFSDNAKAIEVKAECENGVLKGTSIGFDIIEYSEEPRLLLKGQTKPTVTKCDLLEISIVGIPANPRAIRLKLSSQGLDDQLPYLNFVNMEKIALTLGLLATATEDQILGAIATLQQEQVETALAMGVRKGFVTDANREQYRSALKLNFASTKLMFDLAPEKDVTAAPITTTATAITSPTTTTQTIASQLRAAGLSTVPMGSDKDNWSFDDWQKKDSKGLSAMRKENRAKYSILAAAYYDDKKGYK